MGMGKTETAYWQEVLDALYATPDPPTNYALTPEGVRSIAECYDWQARWEDHCWSTGEDHQTLGAMVSAHPADFLADISRYGGDDYYL